MNNIDILGFLGPLVPLLFAGTFFVFWLGQRNAPHILVTGVSFALFSASLFLSQYYFELLDFKMLTTSLVLTSFAVILFTHAMSLRLEIETPKTLMISIALVGVLLGGFASLNIPDIGLRAFILCATLGALFLVSGLNVLKAKEQSRVNCTISILKDHLYVHHCGWFRKRKKYYQSLEMSCVPPLLGGSVHHQNSFFPKSEHCVQ